MHPFLYNKYFSRIAFAPDDEGGRGGGGGSSVDEDNNDDNNKDDALTAEQIEELIAKRADEIATKKAEELAITKADEIAKKKIEAETLGLKNKNQELLDKLKKATAQAEKLKGVSDEDLQSMFELRERLKKDEIAKLAAEGKTDEVFERLTKTLRAEHEAKIASRDEEVAKLVKEAEDARSAIQNLLVTTAVAQASGAVKPAYQPLVQGLIEKQLSIVEGKVRVVDDKGDVRFNKAGDPMTVAELVETLRPTYSDLFQASAGGGAGGGSKPGKGGKISIEDAENLPYDEYVKLRAAGKIQST